MKALLVMLVGFSAVTVQTPEIIETPGAPVAIVSTALIESAVVDEDQRAAPAVTVTAHSNGYELVDNFTVRVQIVSSEGNARGFVSRTFGPVEMKDANFRVPLKGWILEASDQLRVSVVTARVGNQTWADGVWTEDPEMELPVAAACAPNFCQQMSEACNVTCKRAGCILTFKCRMGPKYCESSCVCRLNIICGGQ